MELKDSGTRSEFSTGAVRDCQEGKGRCDLLWMRTLLRVAQHFEDGARKYGDDNWRRGIPLRRFMDSGMRHLFKHLRGDRDEPHLIAAIWNFGCLYETQCMIEEGLLPAELNDLPNNPLAILDNPLGIQVTIMGVETEKAVLAVKNVNNLAKCLAGAKINVRKMNSSRKKKHA